MNKPSGDWYEVKTIDGLIDTLKQMKNSYNQSSSLPCSCYIHCFKSQMRGPKCTRKLLDRMEQLEVNPDSLPSISVMQSGYEHFERCYRSNDPTLFDRLK